MRADRSSGSRGAGVVLIAVGSAFLGIQAVGLDVGRYGWPMVIVGAGALMLLVGLSGFDASYGLIFPGTIVTSIGLILLYQNTTGHWESWAYAWALIPASVGLALALHGAVTGRAAEARTGRSMSLTFLLFFAAGAAFFEGVLHISGRDLGPLAQYGLPVLLIATGVWLLIARTFAAAR